MKEAIMKIKSLIQNPDCTTWKNASLWKSLGAAERSRAGNWRPKSASVCLTGMAGFVALLGVTFPLPADTIYVSNYGDSTVTRITADGQKQIFASGLRLPYGLAFDDRGNLLCASGQTNQLYSLDKNGMLRTYGSGPRFANLIGLAFDAQGRLYAADQNNNAVVRLLPGGGVTNFAAGLSTPWGLAFDAGGNLSVANYGNSMGPAAVPPWRRRPGDAHRHECAHAAAVLAGSG
jgi:hypothetical protein